MSHISKTSDAQVESLVRTHGEHCRIVIVDALRFLDETEASWHLDKPIWRRTYIKDLLKVTKKGIKRDGK